MSAAKFWPWESRNLIGPLTIELSTEVNCLHDFNLTAIAKEQLRSKSAEVKCVALINSRHSRRILLRMAFGLTQAVSHLEQRNTSTVTEVCIPFYRIVSRNFHLTAFS